MVAAVTDETFQDTVLASARPVVVDFWAPWCPPCAKLSVTLRELAEEYGDRVLVVELNSDDNPLTTLAYRVMSMPTLLVFREGEVVGSIVGARPKAALRQALSAYVPAP